MDNLSTAAPTQVTIGDKHKRNNTDTLFNKNFYQGKGGEIVDDEVDDDQEKGGNIADYEGHDDREKGGEIVRNQSISAPAQATIGAKHTHNTTK